MSLRLRSIFEAFVVLSLVASPSLAQTGAGAAADRIEEDWKLVIGDPDSDSTGPQITTCMRPVSGSKGFIAFCLNYRDNPDWKPGGLQIKAYGEPTGASQALPLVASVTAETDSLDTEGEIVTWTQRIMISPGTLSYTVQNGSSTTWGGFGQGQGNLAVNYSTTAADLGGYDPTDSVSLSAAGWQANRVTSMTLLTVRYYKAGVLIATDDAPRAVKLSGSDAGTTP